MFTVAQLTDGLGYSPLRLRTLFRSLGFDDTPSGEVELSVDDCSRLWLFMLIDNLTYLPEEARTLLIEKMTSITAVGKLLEDDPACTPTLVIADNRYAIWYHTTAWLDLTTGKTVNNPATPPLETRAYHLGVLFRRNKMALTTRTRDHAANPVS